MEQAQARTHPVLIAAGIAVLLFSLLGAAALTGILPVGISKQAEPAAVAQKGVTTPPASVAPARPAPKPATATAVAPCANCGVIDSIQAHEVKGKTSGMGAVAGGVAGGLLGNQIGSGNTRTVMTVGGAAGGAFAGDAIEGQVKKQTVWRIAVRLEDGTVRTLSQGKQPPFAVGDRVRIVNGTNLERV